MLRATSTPKDKLEAIIGAVSQLPQRIVWKWEEKNLPGNPKNIYISNWLPQNDILGIAFILQNSRGPNYLLNYVNTAREYMAGIMHNSRDFMIAPVIFTR